LTACSKRRLRSSTKSPHGYVRDSRDWIGSNGVCLDSLIISTISENEHVLQ
jgi:hypothetical protein